MGANLLRAPLWGLILTVAFLLDSSSTNVVLAWSTRATTARRGASSSLTTTSRLYNIPPPSETDTQEFKEFASKQSPPASFYELQQDCIRAARLARRDGHCLLEVEFPPLPARVLEMDDISTYDVLQANLKLALEFSKGLMAAEQSSSSGDNTNKISKVAILLPDQAELDYAIEKVGGSANPYPGVVITSIRQADPNDTRLFQPEQLLLGLFGRGSGGAVKPVHGADVYVCLGVSAQELPDVEELFQLEQQQASDNNQTVTPTIVFYNLKLDILRGDLGAPAFPPKAFQDRFLSRVKPVYYLRTRQYSRSTPRPPFLVNFQGCLFRSYPGQFQTLLDTGTGRYRRICGSDFRPPLGQFKQELTDELIRQGVLFDEGTTLQFLRTGYKTTTWWEEERPEADDAWRT